MTSTGAQREFLGGIDEQIFYNWSMNLPSHLAASSLYNKIFSEAHLDMSWCCFSAGKKTQLQFSGYSHVKKLNLFSYDELISATENFHPSNRIGRGGFGTVYQGTLRNGTQIAAKVLSVESKQGVNEFLNEIDVIRNIKHPNLVELVGCCVQETHRILVYEYVENKSLDHVLLGSSSQRLNWDIRSRICLGIAKGLAYLHEEVRPHIVHRDIKASNVLLDNNFDPKIGDFGLAKLFPDNVTHLSTRVAGTTGYLAPEYAAQGKLTRKADVYSFGVLVLEVISARSSSKAAWSEMEKYLLEWTWELYEEGRLGELIDPELKEYPEEKVVSYIKVALFCTQGTPALRPTMTEVAEMLLEPIRLNEKELTPPGILLNSKKIEEGSKAKKSSLDSFFNSASNRFTSAPVSMTEMDPR